MALETGTYISDLVTSNPAHTDGLNQADSHIRLIKAALKNTFPSINGPVALTDEILNALVPLIAVPDGSAGAPSIAFAASPTLGFYRSGPGVMSLVGGMLRGNGLIPAGALVDFATPTAPEGWLACDGQSYLTSSYPDLFAAIGYQWGGTGGTFFVPNAKNRYARHRDASGLAGALATYQDWLVGAHTHGASGTAVSGGAHTHPFAGTTGADDPVHTHTIPGGSAGYGTTSGNTQVWSPSVPGNIFTSINAPRHVHTFSGTTDSDGAHGHVLSISVAANVGVENRPQSMTVLRCIKT